MRDLVRSTSAWTWSRRLRVRAALAALLLAQAYGVVALHPFQLSYYNALVGGVRVWF